MGVQRESVRGHVRGKRPAVHPPPADKVLGHRESEHGIHEAAQAQQVADAEDCTQAAAVVGEDTEGDPEDGEGACRGRSADRQGEKDHRHRHEGVPAAEQPLRERQPEGEHPRQDSERVEAVCEAHSQGQGGEERGVRREVQQHPGGRDLVHREAVVQRLQRGLAAAAQRQDAQASVRGGCEEDRRRHGLRGGG